MKKGYKTNLIIALVFVVCVFGFNYCDSRMAYYGNSLCNHYVLPFHLQVISGWSHEQGRVAYGLGCFGEIYGDFSEIAIHYNDSTPNRYIRMQTILSYGYNEKEVIIHWLGCDSTEYYVRLNSYMWKTLSPEQFIREEQITKNDYKWINLFERNIGLRYLLR